MLTPIHAPPAIVARTVAAATSGRKGTWRDPGAGVVPKERVCKVALLREAESAVRPRLISFIFIVPALILAISIETISQPGGWLINMWSVHLH